MRLKIEDIRSHADGREGYVEAFLSEGRMDGDFLELGDEAVGRITRKFSGSKVIRASKAFLRWAAADFPNVTDEVLSLRQSSCNACPHQTKSGGCNLCGCTKLKLHWATERCPLPEPKWTEAVDSSRIVNGSSGKS